MFNRGDLIVFTKDIKAGTERCVSDRGQIRIPKYELCKIERINDSHMWVLYKDKVFMLRNIPSRMIYPTKAAKVLFGSNK